MTSRETEPSLEEATPAPAPERHAQRYESDDRRVITRFLGLEPQRIRSVLERVLALPEPRVRSLLEEVRRDFADRHPDLEAEFVRHFHDIRPELDALGPHGPLSEERKLLIGAHFTHEYSIESAALFNPSMVPHPDQRGTAPGATRFLMSLRAVGEGHLSSIVFRTGEIDADGRITFEPAPRFAFTARPVPDKLYEKSLFLSKLYEIDEYHGAAQQILDPLPDHFDYEQLRAALDACAEEADPDGTLATAAANMDFLANANYELRFPEHARPSEIVIFPATELESSGMEDLRLAPFVDEDTGEPHFCGTYTAYDGVRMIPMMLETRDFRRFHISTLNGRYVRNKGMAVFPRKVGGSYLMISRHDGENLYLLRSPHLHFWNSCEFLMGPREPWETIQIGNCGSPVETEAGWILLTHGVGPMRRYCIGALLLDLEDPARVIGRLREPLLVPTGEEREGYVPNVVYSCGPMIHGRKLVVPYAMADLATTIATVDLDELIAALKASGP